MRKYQIQRGFITQKISDKLNIFDGEESALYTFNKTATFIFEKLKQGLEERKIIGLLIKRYLVKKDRAEKDFKDFLKELVKRKIVVWSEK